MVQKAIVLSYVEDQNEPSIPLNRLVEIPEYAADQKKVFQELFNMYFEFNDDGSELEVSYGHAYGFGDVNIHKDGCYIYLTYVD